MMTDRKDKRYVSCPVCGRILMKCQGAVQYRYYLRKMQQGDSGSCG